MEGEASGRTAVTAKFLTPLQLENIDGRTMMLLTPLKYQTDVRYLGVIVVPRDFVTDFASVPRGLWNLFPPNGPYTPAAVVHDYLYRWTEHDRKLCDEVFLEAMEVLKVGWWTRQLMYRAVRLFGRRQQ